jgi:group II intron reverse transcriptase/maturase
MKELIDQILQNTNLTNACKDVIDNKGAGGVDGMSFKELKSYLDQNRQVLVEQVKNGEYHAQPIRGKEIPKGKGKTRLLGIPTVVDRMLQQAVVRIISSRYEFEFSNYSYGFRPKRNIVQAAGKALSYINSGNQHIVEIDLKQFFDEVDHTLLLQLLYRKIKCKDTMRLIRRWLRAPLEINGKLTKRRKGIPQGSPISPFLSNVILHELDKEMENQNLQFVRYADDFSIYCKTKSEARKAGNNIYIFLRDKLKLPINKSKSGIRRPVYFQFLGFGFVPIYKKGVKGKYQLVITKEKWKSFKNKLKEITRKTSPLSFDERIKKLNATINGWIESRKHANILSKLEELDGWLRNRLRGCIWHDWKKPERKRKNLIRLGVKPDMAYAWSRTNMGRWAVAQSPILGTTITLSHLQRRGYVSMASVYKKKTANLAVNPLFALY